MKRVVVILLSVVAAVALVVLVGILVLRPLLSLDRGADFERPGVLVVDLDGLVVERAPPDLFSAELEDARLELFDLAVALDRAARDDRIAGVHLRIGRSGFGWAKAEEVRERLERFRESGKFVHAHTAFTDELGYYVALAGDRIDVMPDAGMALNGFRVETPFVRPLLEKLGLDPQVEAIGVYKTAADMFRRENMSDEHREVTAAMLAERYERFVGTVVEGRGIGRERFEAALADGVYLARDLLALDLVDGEEFATEARRRAVAEARGVPIEDVRLADVDRHFVGVGAYAREARGGRAGAAGTIGVVYAVGAISGGESRYDPVLGRTIGAASFIETLREVAADRELDAVVVRVDSPGGDALASQEIAAALDDLGERMPVVVSMSDVAASGGYMIAAAADAIVAHPSTVTGSIGVFAVLFNAEETWDKLGIRWETVRTNPAADFPTSTRPLTDAERATFRTLVEDVYRSFVAMVAEGRDLPVDEVDRIAQGRVWTGSQAEGIGLVDRLGGLDAAIDVAREAAGLDADAAVNLHVYPKKERLVDRLRDAFLLRQLDRGGAGAGTTAEGLLARTVAAEIGELATGVAALLREGPRRPLAVLPWLPRVR